MKKFDTLYTHFSIGIHMFFKISVGVGQSSRLSAEEKHLECEIHNTA